MVFFFLYGHFSSQIIKKERCKLLYIKFYKNCVYKHQNLEKNFVWILGIVYLKMKIITNCILMDVTFIIILFYWFTISIIHAKILQHLILCLVCIFPFYVFESDRLNDNHIRISHVANERLSGIHVTLRLARRLGRRMLPNINRK